jgi:DNA-directed RNA polymerase subunit beta'
MNRSGSLVVQDAKGRDRERYPIVYGARLKVKEGQASSRARCWSSGIRTPFSILTEEPGQIRFKDILEGHHGARGSRRGHRPLAPHHRRLAGREEAAGGRDQGQGRQGQPQVPHAVARALDGAGRRDGVGGRRAREDSARDDEDQGHHGGLPRVVELFEARKPRETAVISEIDGIVKHGGIVKGQRKIIIVPDEPGAEPREYSLPRGVHVNVQEGERVRAGEPLMDGPSNPHDILNVLGRRRCSPTW